jgi:hypothetical protein
MVITKYKQFQDANTFTLTSATSLTTSGNCTLVQNFLNLIHLLMELMLQEDLNLDAKWTQMTQHNLLK